MFNTKNIFVILISLFGGMLAVSACANQPAESDIVTINWQWTGLVETSPAFQSVVPDPENYTLTLNADGTISIKADCNMVSGSYKLEEDSLLIELGATTLAYCGDDSADQKFLESLSLVTSYVVENGQLTLFLDNETGQMTFTQ